MKLSPFASRTLGPLVLVAEDDTYFRRLVASFLRRDGFRVATVGTGSELMDFFEEVWRGAEPPAVVISDDRMPGQRGLLALQRARDWGWRRPLVLITAFGDGEVDSLAGEAGVYVMKKPFEMDDLRTLVWQLAE